MWVDRQILTNVGIQLSIIAPKCGTIQKAIIHVIVPRDTMGMEEKMVKVVPRIPPH
jgi:hypothetical protein